MLQAIESHACDINQGGFPFSSICHINTARVTVLMEKDLMMSERAFLELQLALTVSLKPLYSNLLLSIYISAYDVS
jgi:hypothetical protein